jgi:hypothetical protein
MRELDETIKHGDLASFNEIFDQVLGLSKNS